MDKHRYYIFTSINNIIDCINQQNKVIKSIEDQLDLHLAWMKIHTNENTGNKDSNSFGC